MKWCNEDIELLKMNYVSMDVYVLKDKLKDCRSVASIRAKAAKLGLRKVNRRKWNKKEDEIVCSVYLFDKIIGSKVKYINDKLVEAGFLPRTDNSINAKYENYKWLDTKEGYKMYTKQALITFIELSGNPFPYRRKKDNYKVGYLVDKWFYRNKNKR